MIKAVIFDMDGLMIDSERLTYKGYKHVFKENNYDLSIELYIKTLGKNLQSTELIYKQELGQDLPFEDLSRQAETFIENTLLEKGIPIKKGLIDLLKYLKDHHYQTIVATSSTRERLNRILKQAHLSSYFDNAICGNEVLNSKPDPEIFLKACQKLNILPSDAIVLEDSEAGIQAASLACIPVICIPDMKYPETEYASKCYQIKDSLTDVLNWLKNI